MQQTRLINFRASPQLARAINAAAEQGGVTASEIIREAVEDRIAKCVSKPGSPAAFDPFDKLAAAARGSRQAQRDLAHEAVRMAFDRDDEGEFLSDPVSCLADGLVFARLAAAHGDMADQGLVISMLALLSEVCGAEHCAERLAEAIARVSLVADAGGHGSEEAAHLLPELAGEASPETMALAKSYRRRIRDELETPA